MNKNSIILIFALFALARAAVDDCEEGFSYCPVINACYEPSQYTCTPDFFHGENRLCGVGTVSCNDVCIAECAYRCDANGTYSVRADRTCPPPPNCFNNDIACGAACYNSDLFCCVSGTPTDIKSCPSADDDQFCHPSSTSVIVLHNVGSLHDGQLRLDYGPGAFDVNFTLCDGVITDDRGQTCYISDSYQLQCNTPPQTDNYVGFCLEGDYLSYNGQNLWYECDVGTGGSNLYTRAVDNLACAAVYLLVQEKENDTPYAICPSAGTTSSTFSTSSTVAASTTSSTVAASTTSSTKAASTTSSTVAPSTTSSTVAASTSSTVAPSTTSSTKAASTTSSTKAASTTSSTKAASTTSSTKAASTTSSTKAPSTTSSTKAPSTTKAASTTSSTKAPSTSSIYTPSTYSAPPTSSACPPDWKSSGAYLPVPFLYYSFDYGCTSTKVRDDSNHGRDGKIVGSPSVVDGIYKSGLKFTGRGYQTIKVDSCSSLGKDFTIATWLKMDTKDDRKMKIVTTKSGLWTLITGWELEFCPKTGKVVFYSGLCAISWTIDVDVDEWFHLALTADGNGNTALFFNGRMVGRSQYIKISKFTGSLHVASSRTDCVLAGSIDEFVIFDTALTVEQIEIIKNNNCPTGATKSAASTYKTTSTYKLPATTSHKPASTTKVVVPSTTKTTTKPHKPCGLPWLYWSFDRNKNGKCTDDSGHKRHGTVTGGWGSIGDGKLRKSCKWSGKKVQHISLPSCELHSAFTVSLWLKIDSFSSGKSFVIATTKSSATDSYGWEVQFQASTKKIIFYAAGSSKAEWSVDVQAGVFFHVAVSVDNSKVKCHINGEDKGQKSVSACRKSTKSLTVAGRTSLNVQLEGTIDEFLLFDRVLDTEQICSARDTYQTGHETSSWSKNTWDWDFGDNWERSSRFNSNTIDRLNNWWKFN